MAFLRRRQTAQHHLKTRSHLANHADAAQQRTDSTMSDQTQIIPEHLEFMDDEKKWEGLIRLLQNQANKMQGIEDKLKQMSFEQSRMAEDLEQIKEELTAAKEKLSEIDKVKFMAMGGKAALLAVGAGILWLFNNVADVFNKK